MYSAFSFSRFCFDPLVLTVLCVCFPSLSNKVLFGYDGFAIIWKIKKQVRIPF